MLKLVIVESPAKAKTISKYLGKNYEVAASMGHVRDLPAKRLSVSIKKSFAPKYEILEGKEKYVKDLVKRAKKCEDIYLATDPDREGEAISWHLAHILKVAPNRKNRVVFNEITKTGVKKGISNPRCIDQNLVDAQQARRILDRLVGYKLSPFLSSKIRKGLSAGRVQSVTLRIIVDREEKIRSFVPEEYWTINARLSSKESLKDFSALFYGDETGKIKITNKTQVNKILKSIEKKDFIALKVKKGIRKRKPSPPFITSTLQQEASRKLSFTPKRTMKIAQELYEGIDTKKFGLIGLITYMRTDSTRVSEDAVKTSRSFIASRWKNKYIPSKPRVYKARANSQDGHEAIRPTMPELSPEEVKNDLSTEQYKIYKLIWSRFIASQMEDCLHATTSANIKAGDYIFKASGYNVKFDGFTVLYQEKKEEKSKQLPELREGEKLELHELKSNQHFTEPPPRFNEASLIKVLEEEGIGRPSTYAPTISTILSREYVLREEKNLKPTELGEVIINFLKEKFPKIVNLEFTAQMESDLDTVEKAKRKWVDILEEFYTPFEEQLKEVKEQMKGMKIPLKEDQTDIICELCGRSMVVKIGRFGKFIACPGYPECKNIKNFVNKIGVPCPKCNQDIILKKSKKGRTFYGCSAYPKCDFVSWDEPSKKKCPRCSELLFFKKNKKKTLYCVVKNCGYTEESQKKSI
ncbi:MAG: type I DNA topoisomerase [Oscillospiraceae bacterium]|jgi:DNA topoisomerase-1|nr:type I DNA topoisomerase [Oscillospiraceae bacterium]